MTTFALLAWPVLILALSRRLPLPHLILVALIGGYLLLPTRGAWDFPLLPPFNKNNIPAMTVLFLALLISRSSAKSSGGSHKPVTFDQPGWIPRSPVGIIPLGLIVVGAFLTVATNSDQLVYGPRTIQGLRPYDAFSIAMLSLVTLIPLFLGRKFFAHPDRHRLLLHALVIAGLAYSFLALYEIRMSPQLNNMVYGYFPHSWVQHIRGGGWRPLVFLWHGLALAFFFVMTILAAFGSSRFAPASQKSFYMMAGGWLLMTLVLSNSLGALIVALLLVPFVFLFGVRGKLLVAAIFAGITLTYPMLRGIDVVPTERLVSLAADIDEGRASSLAFRFNEEDVLLEHARERPLFGWGTFGRNRIYNARGENISTTDGYWIVVFGTSGWVGYLAEFGLLTIPPILLAWRSRRTRIEPETAILSLIMAAQLIYLIPNGFMSPVSWLIAGALLGRLEFERAAVTEPDEMAQSYQQNTRYARPVPTAASVERPVRGREGEAPVYSRQTQLHRRAERQRG